MGLSPEYPDYQGGVACNLCKDVIFDGKTPFFVEAWVSGIIQCPGMRTVPGNITVLLSQDTPCRWILNGPPWTYVWELSTAQSLMTITFGGEFAFQRILTAECISEFKNANQTCGLPVAGRFGFVFIFWGPTIGV